jgi:uncharacterized protein (TIGR00730 family)
MATPPNKAYENLPFLRSRDARMLRIFAEYLEPQSRLRRRRIRSAIVFFGSSSTLDREQARQQYGAVAAGRVSGASEADVRRARHQLRLAEYYEDARVLARRVTEWARESGAEGELVVCSGGGPGMMEAANRGAAEAGGQSVGLTISLPHEPLPNRYISPGLAVEFHYFFMRKFWFMYLARALVVFPGGYGTMDELFEVLTLLQTRKVQRPVEVIVYGREYWDEVVNFEKLVEWGTIRAEDRQLIHLVDDVEEAFTILTRTITAPKAGKSG